MHQELVNLQCIQSPRPFLKAKKSFKNTFRSRGAIYTAARFVFCKGEPPLFLLQEWPFRSDKCNQMQKIHGPLYIHTLRKLILFYNIYLGPPRCCFPRDISTKIMICISVYLTCSACSLPSYKYHNITTKSVWTKIFLIT